MNIQNKNLLPVITSENDVYPYLKKINQFPILSDEEEKRLAINWLKNGDTKAAQKLVTSHLRLVAKIAMGYKGYGLPIFDFSRVGDFTKPHGSSGGRDGKRSPKLGNGQSWLEPADSKASMAKI